MGIFARIKEVVKANINDIKDKKEDPEKSVNEYIVKLTESLAEIKHGISELITQEERITAQINENSEQISKYQEFAEKAVKAGNDDDAKIFIEKKQSYSEKNEKLNKTYASLKLNLNRMKELHDKLTENINELETRRQEALNKMTVAQSQEIMNEIALEMNSYSDIMIQFEKLEQEADSKFESTKAMNSDSYNDFS